MTGRAGGLRRKYHERASHTRAVYYVQSTEYRVQILLSVHTTYIRVRIDRSAQICPDLPNLAAGKLIHQYKYQYGVNILAFTASSPPSPATDPFLTPDEEPKLLSANDYYVQ
jgi:hypothetical protein